MQLEEVAILPVGVNGGSDLVGAVALYAESSVFLPCGGQPARLSVLLVALADPVVAGVVAH